LLTFDSQRYRLLAWVVMPNHVHILFQPINRWTVAKIVAAWKKISSLTSPGDFGVSVARVRGVIFFLTSLFIDSIHSISVQLKTVA